MALAFASACMCVCVWGGGGGGGVHGTGQRLVIIITKYLHLAVEYELGLIGIMFDTTE